MVRLKCTYCDKDQLGATVGPNNENYKPYKGKYFVDIFCWNCGRGIFRWCEIAGKTGRNFRRNQMLRYADAAKNVCDKCKHPEAVHKEEGCAHEDIKCKVKACKCKKKGKNTEVV